MSTPAWAERARLNDERVLSVLRSDPEWWSQKVLARLTRVGEGCWIWGGTIGDAGYGQLALPTRIVRSQSGHPVTVAAHRALYVHAHGQPVPFGLSLDHLCRNRACAEPSHLEPVPIEVNITRARSLKTACGRCGGPLTLHASGKRGCTPCNRPYAQRQREWIRAKTPTWKAAMEQRGRERATEEQARTLDPDTCAGIVASARWRITVDPSSGCHIWSGRAGTTGYGTLSYRVAPGLWRVRYAHRVALVAFLGRDLTPGMVVDHLCRTPLCVNPEHLEEVPQSVNVARGLRWPPGHCIHGHVFDEENTYIRPDKGTRQCRACCRDRRLARRQAAA